MGCGSVTNQTSDSQHHVSFKPYHILQTKPENHINLNYAMGTLYLFGETKTNRKILEMNFNSFVVKTLSNRTRIPKPKIKYNALQLLYQQSQQLFASSLYNFSSLPPFNQMVCLYLQQNIIFLCGGKDYEGYNVKCEAYIYEIIDSEKKQSHVMEGDMKDRTIARSKFSNNKFQKIASMAKHRYAHMGLYYRTNHQKSIYVFGGIDQDHVFTATCQKYNIIENSWKEIASLAKPRAKAMIFQFLNKIYIFGGRQSESKLSKKIEVYNPENNLWQILNIKIHRGIESSQLFSIRPNQILIVGGKDKEGSINSVIQIDISQQTYIWDSELEFYENSPKGVLSEGNIFIFGSHKKYCQVYDQKNNKWEKEVFKYEKQFEEKTLEQFSLSSESLIVQSTNQIIDNDHEFQKQNGVLFGNDRYPCLIQLNGQSFKLLKRPVPMKLRLKSCMGIVKLNSFQYILCGGCNYQCSKASNTIFHINFQNKIVKEYFKMPSKKCKFAASHFNNFLYVVGGFDPSTAQSVRTCETFDLQNEKWHSMVELKHARSNAWVCILKEESKLLIFGGEQVVSLTNLNSNKSNSNNQINMNTHNKNFTTDISSFEIYDIKTNQMRTILPSLTLSAFQHLQIAYIYAQLQPNQSQNHNKIQNYSHFHSKSKQNVYSLVIIGKNIIKEVYQIYTVEVDLNQVDENSSQKQYDFRNDIKIREGSDTEIKEISELSYQKEREQQNESRFIKNKQFQKKPLNQQEENIIIHQISNKNKKHEGRFASQIKPFKQQKIVVQQLASNVIRVRPLKGEQEQQEDDSFEIQKIRFQQHEGSHEEYYQKIPLTHTIEEDEDIRGRQKQADADSMNKAISHADSTNKAISHTDSMNKPISHDEIMQVLEEKSKMAKLKSQQQDNKADELRLVDSIELVRLVDTIDLNYNEKYLCMNPDDRSQLLYFISETQCIVYDKNVKKVVKKYYLEGLDQFKIPFQNALHCHSRIS